MIAAVATVAASSFAQTSMNGFGLSVGAFFPQNTALKNATSNTGWMIAVDYALGQGYSMGQGGSAKPSLEVGYARNGGSDNLSTFSALLMNRMNFSMGGSEKGGFAPYFLAGIGFFRHSTDIGGVTDDENRFGGVVGLGADVAQRTAIEAGWRFSGKINGTNTDGFFARVRFRF